MLLYTVFIGTAGGYACDFAGLCSGSGGAGLRFLFGKKKIILEIDSMNMVLFMIL